MAHDVRAHYRAWTNTPGTFLTFAQFLYVTFQTLPSQIYFKPGSSIPRWRKNEVPLSRWMVQVVLFFTVNLSRLSRLASH